MRHRFINDGVAPIPMGVSAEYVCVCGRRGTRSAIAKHIAESVFDNDADEDSDAIIRSRLDTDDGFGGATLAHYLPAEPRRPASPTPAPPMTELPSLPFEAIQPRSIAESFQDMLRTAYQAGVESAKSGETFESWYQREVLQ